MVKNDIRRLFKEKRTGLSSKDLEDYSLKIANQVLQLPIWQYSFYHTFLSIHQLKEINTDYILNILAGKDKHIVISKSHFEDLSMSHFLLSDDTKLIPNAYGIPEPENGIPIDVKMIDVVFVPLLAFDTFGHRVGYGKGFYDRFLTLCRPECLKIGLSFFKPVETIPEVSPQDVRLDYGVTPDAIFTFN